MANVMSKFRGNPTDDELAEVLPVGYKDPKSPNWIPPELRQAVADFDAAMSAKMRDNIIRGVTGSVSRGRHVINPRDSERDLETAVLWQTVAYVANRQRSDAARLERAAHDARMHTCAACGTVSVPGMNRTGAVSRTLVDGTRWQLCERCAPIAEGVALDRLGNEKTVNGTNRGTAVRTLLGAVK